MKELSFSQGRLSFDKATLLMVPCLPESLEYRIKAYFVSEDGLIETMFSDFDGLSELRKEHKLVWLHLTGSPGDEFWQHLRQFLELSDEQMKYLRGPHSSCLFEDFDNGSFWSLHRPSVTDNVDAIESINFFMSDKVLITRQFSHDQAFLFCSHKLMEKGPQLKNNTVDRLASVLIGDVVSAYVDLLKMGGTRLEVIQNKIIHNPGKDELHMINRAQQMIWIFLNHVWPIETVLQAIQRSPNSVWTDEGKHQIKHRQDEAESVVRMFETYRAMSYNLMDVYVSNLSLRTNRTTTVLTMIATLFMPPSLIAAIYGMNFFIPEVHAAFGYYFCLCFMFVISGGLLFWLKYKGFLEM